MKNNFPLVSVIIPAFNSEKYIEQTITSALNQTYKNLEIIVVDDGSTDRTLEIVKQLSEKDNRIKYFSIPPAGRPSVPRNFGIHKANGEFIAFLDSDDLWHKRKIANQLKRLIESPSAAFIYSMSITFGAVSLFSAQYELLPLPFRAAKNRNDLLKIGNTIPLSSVIVRKDNLLDVNGFDEDPLLQIEDYDLWIRLSEINDFVFLPALFVKYRIHSTQFSVDWETHKKRLNYLSKKRMITLPEYKKIRQKGIILSFIRNVIHFKLYIIYTLITFFRR